MLEEIIEEYCENELVLFGELTSKGLELYTMEISIQDENGEWVTLNLKEQTKWTKEMNL